MKRKTIRIHGWGIRAFMLVAFSLGLFLALWGAENGDFSGKDIFMTVAFCVGMVLVQWGLTVPKIILDPNNDELLIIAPTMKKHKNIRCLSGVKWIDVKMGYADLILTVRYTGGYKEEFRYYGRALISLEENRIRKALNKWFSERNSIHASEIQDNSL